MQQLFRHWLRLLGLLTLLGIPVVAGACIHPPPPVQLPNETNAEWKARTYAIEQARLDRYYREHESRVLEQASTVFIGQVVRSGLENPERVTDGIYAIIKPISALKGMLPTQDVKLETALFTSCGPEGGGRAVTARAGSLVIVFEGVEPYGFSGQTTDSVLAADVREEQLVDDVNKFLLGHPEYRPETG